MLTDEVLIDAKQLKDAALKNAEQIILEQYSEKVKESVDKILSEQFDEDLEDDPLGGPMADPLGGQMTDPMAAPMTDPLAGPPAGTAIDPGTLADVPDASTEKEVAEDEDYVVVDLDLGDLALDQSGEVPTDTMGMGDLAGDVGLPTEPPMAAGADLGNDLAVPETSPEEEDLLSEATLQELYDELTAKEEDPITLDEGPEKSGFSAVPSPVVARNNEVAEAGEAVKAYNEENRKLKESLSRYSQLFESLKTKITEMETLNSILVLKNKTLSDPSLNERQKTKIVEAVGQAKNAEEAKTLFETLSKALQSEPGKRLPNTLVRLDEVIRNRSSQRIPSVEMTDEVANRFQRLAGIKKD